MKILSFDCANRSLAVCFVEINDNFFENIINGLKEKKEPKGSKIQAIDHIINKCSINYINVFDLTEGQECDTVNRTHRLKKCLTELDKIITSEDQNWCIDIVLVEYQMSVNDKSRCVSQQILYHYSNLSCKVYLVGPTLKNKIYFKEDLDYGHFMSKYSSKYTANKNHTKENFLYWLTENKKTEIIEKIKKKNIDDAADAFMQVFGWLEYKYFKS